jgi:hypothetical protein
MMTPNRPDDSAAAINTFWASIDSRVSQTITDTLYRSMGIPRARGMSVNIPIAGATETPIPGWLQSVILFHTCRISAWEISALDAGQVTLDVRISAIRPSPATAPTLTSMPGASNYLSLNGYTTAGYDTSNWTRRDIQAGEVIHIFVLSATSIKRAILGLQLLDLTGKVLQL